MDSDMFLKGKVRKKEVWLAVQTTITNTMFLVGCIKGAEYNNADDIIQKAIGNIAKLQMLYWYYEEQGAPDSKGFKLLTICSKLDEDNDYLRKKINENTVFKFKEEE